MLRLVRLSPPRSSASPAVALLLLRRTVLCVGSSSAAGTSAAVAVAVGADAAAAVVEASGSGDSSSDTERILLWLFKYTHSSFSSLSNALSTIAWNFTYFSDMIVPLILIASPSSATNSPSTRRSDCWCCANSSFGVVPGEARSDRNISHKCAAPAFTIGITLPCITCCSAFSRGGWKDSSFFSAVTRSIIMLIAPTIGGTTCSTTFTTTATVRKSTAARLMA
mmetsp:Transcript_36121/g.88274  ORF Transcript_36121/g.88274 Transcript_36121/m.88274 type:complete len:223 (-) Transcript_36121:347-1015(-)